MKSLIVALRKVYIHPEEEFWDDIPKGSELEKWCYEQNDGNLNLYFVDGRGKLGYKAFVPKRVVYENFDE